MRFFKFLGTKKNKVSEKDNFQENSFIFTNEECCICYENIKKDEIIVLPCSHKLDIKCYDKYKESIKQRISCSFNCPMCRTPIEQEVCQCKICNEILDKESVNYMKNIKCGCEFHYTCYNENNTNYYREKRHKCIICLEEHNEEDLEVYSYLYFPEGYQLWVNDLKSCRDNNCNNNGNPKSGNYCSLHRKYTVKNREVIKAFKYFTQRGIGMSREEKEKLFLEMIANGEKV